MVRGTYIELFVFGDGDLGLIPLVPLGPFPGPDGAAQIGAHRYVDVEAVDVGSVHKVPEGQTAGVTGGRHWGADELGRVIWLSRGGGLNVHIVSIWNIIQIFYVCTCIL